MWIHFDARIQPTHSDVPDSAIDRNPEARFSGQTPRGVVHADQKNGVGKIDIPAFGLGPPPQ
jgi:hypothetical protein